MSVVGYAMGNVFTRVDLRYSAHIRLANPFWLCVRVLHVLFVAALTRTDHCEDMNHHIHMLCTLPPRMMWTVG